MANMLVSEHLIPNHIVLHNSLHPGPESEGPAEGLTILSCEHALARSWSGGADDVLLICMDCQGDTVQGGRLNQGE
jgi:hypothetical protein